MGDIIFFAILAGFILFRFFKVLGQDNGKRPTKKKDDNSSTSGNATTKNNIVSFPSSTKKQQVEPAVETTLEKRRKVKDPEITDIQLAKNIEKIKDSDNNFRTGEFLVGAKSAFEMVINAFSQGDKKTLKNLLSNNVYKDFEKEIDKSLKSGKHQETTLIAITQSDIIEAQLIRNKIRITVSFISEQINLIKENDGDVVDGDPSLIEDIADSWIFERDTKAASLNWQVVAT